MSIFFHSVGYFFEIVSLAGQKVFSLMWSYLFFFLFVFVFFFGFLLLLGPLPRHMEVPRLGVQLEL